MEIMPYLPQFITTIVGFLMMLAVLWKFAWGPVMDLLDRRREEIQGDYDKVENLQKEMETQKADYDSRMRDIETTAREKLNEALEEGRRISAEIQEKARVDAEEVRDQAARNIQMQLQQARIELRNAMVDIVMNTTGKLLSEKVTEEVDRGLVDAYIDELEKARSN
jgi:F-type H+-transporting ATPase subunit b